MRRFNCISFPAARMRQICKYTAESRRHYCLQPFQDEADAFQNLHCERRVIAMEINDLFLRCARIPCKLCHLRWQMTIYMALTQTYVIALDTRMCFCGSCFVNFVWHRFDRKGSEFSFYLPYFRNCKLTFCIHMCASQCFSLLRHGAQNQMLMLGFQILRGG